MKNFLNKNITWGAYIKVSIICTAVGFAVWAIYLALVSFVPKGVAKIKKKFSYIDKE